MGAKKLVYGEEARVKLLEGIDIVANAVKVTLGPAARTVVLEKSWGSPAIINDGVTIAKDIDLGDPFANMGAKLIQEVASKTQDNAGDGTSTASILAQSLCHHGLKNMESGSSPVELKVGFDLAIEAVVEALKARAVPVETSETIKQVATIASNNDEEIGALIAEAVDAVGREGVITVEEAKSIETTLNVVEGMEFNKGYMSPYMITDREKREAVHDSPLILLTDHTINSAQDLLPTLEASVQQKRPLLIVAKDIEGEALATLVLNVVSKVVKAVAVKAPGFGDEISEQLEDIAVLTGATPLFKDQGADLKAQGPSSLGSADRIIVAKNKTTVVGGGGNKKATEERAELLRGQAKLSTSKWDREKIEKRVGKLTGGVAVLKIGAATETEVKETKARVDDALNATRAAMAEGVVAGGGVTLLRAREVLTELAEAADGDRAIGINLVYEALAAPTRQISANAGADGDDVISNIISNDDENYGYNARSGEYVNMVESGILDPAKVTRNALESAGSIAGLVLTTEVLIADDPDQKVNAPSMPDMGGGMGGMGGMGF
ncbi:MAG TPA: chaperonin GroEL [Candidatus Poseidoniales archaeon]|jgi:chaperonin GroEL|nr:MAG: chaperonin GroEL [Euryarchaeota archaeon]HIG33804.1 chaperonin GroEL [Candidatus Poseidoniales archaeon]HIL67162.1 chaperonin GroEL [Candidatus Poseidoniales archaeon]